MIVIQNITYGKYGLVFICFREFKCLNCNAELSLGVTSLQNNESLFPRRLNVVDIKLSIIIGYEDVDDVKDS